MSETTTYSKLGYLMLKKETTAGTAVYPDTALELLSEDIAVNWAMTPVNTIAGNRELNLRPVLNQVEPATGSIEVLVEPQRFGHFLNGLMGEDSVTTVDTGVYLHTWTPGTTLKTYTMDVKVAGEDYVQRYFGVRIESIEWSIEDNKLKATIGVQAQYAFTNARLTIAHASGTTLDLDQTSGLTTSDTIQVLSAANANTVLATLTIAAVVSETQLTVSTIGASLAVDDIVVIKKQTPAYSLGREFTWKGGASVYLADGASPMQHLAEVTNVEDITLTTTNELEARYGASGCDVIDRFPSTILAKGVSSEVKFKDYHTNPEFLAILRSNTQVGMRVKFCGVALDDNAAVAASATVETDGAETLTVTADTAGEAGNDYAILITQGTGALSASLDGKLITVVLASSAAANTTSLVAAVIHALSGVACSSTGTDHVTTTDNPNKIAFSGGRDALQEYQIVFDYPDVRFQPFNANISTDDLVNEEITGTAFYDSADGRHVRIQLLNTVADY